jgi:hypothetical protein
MSRCIADIKQAAQSISRIALDDRAERTQTARVLRPMTTVQSPNVSWSVVSDRDLPICQLFPNAGSDLT